MTYRTYGYDNGRFYTYEPEKDDRTYVPGRATNASGTNFGERDAPGGALSEWWGGPENSIEGVNPGQHGVLSPTDNQIGTGIASVMGGPSGISAIGKAMRNPTAENVAAAIGTLAVVGAGMAGMAGPVGAIAMLPAITGRLGLTGPTSRAVGPSTQSSNNAVADLGRMMPNNRVTTTPLTPPPMSPTPPAPAGAATTGPSAGPAAPAPGPSPAPGPGPAASVAPDAGPGVGGGGVGIGGVGAPSAGAPAEGQSNAAASAAAAAAAAAAGQAAAATAAPATAPDAAPATAAPDAAPEGTGPGATSEGSTSTADTGPGGAATGGSDASPGTDTGPTGIGPGTPGPGEGNPEGTPGSSPSVKRGGRIYERFKSKSNRKVWHVKDAPEYQKFQRGGIVGFQKGSPGTRRPVRHPQRNDFPGIYDDPRAIVENVQVAPENPAMKMLFGVNRDEHYERFKDRRGNMPGESYLQPSKGTLRGSAHAMGVMTPGNAQRLVDILVEGENLRPDLTRGMHTWYAMEPVHDRLTTLVGPDNAERLYKRFNTFTGMASPGSEVMTEIARGTAANTLRNRGQFDLFAKYGGLDEVDRSRLGVRKALGNSPELLSVPGHHYHPTAHVVPMRKFVDTDEVRMTKPKVPLYISASSIEPLGFQSDTPVPDSHFSRGIGLSDVRTSSDPHTSMTMSELRTIAPWFRREVAEPLGIEAVPAQARLWGSLAPTTGVTSPVGAPKLELLSGHIMKRAKELGVDPRLLRDQIIMGESFKRGGLVV